MAGTVRRRELGRRGRRVGTKSTDGRLGVRGGRREAIAALEERAEGPVQEEGTRGSTGKGIGGSGAGRVYE